MRSSISVKRGVTPASSGKRRRSAAQKEWIVWIRRPPGVSIAWAKRRRASVSLVAEGAASPSARSVSRSRASGIIAQAPSRSKRRFCISFAAALV